MRQTAGPVMLHFHHALSDSSSILTALGDNDYAIGSFLPKLVCQQP
jgi:hypothetical protein